MMHSRKSDVFRLLDYVTDHGADHDESCPGDDTCRCSFLARNEAVNRLVKALVNESAAPPVTDTPQSGEMPPSSTWGDIGPQPKGWPDGNNPVRWKPRPDCVIGVYCQRHGFIHGQEAEELRERLEELGDKAVNRVLDEVDSRDSLAYLEATNEPTPPDVAPAAPPQED